jgi:hypothetical protein
MKTLDEVQKEILSVVIATDDSTQWQAMYVDGIRVQAEETIYASDIELAAKGKPIVLETIEVDLPIGKQFPKRLTACRKLLSPFA